jgi:hypothetical protein
MSWQDNGVASAQASGRGVPYAFGERDRHEKPEKDDDYDTLFDRTA